LTDAIWSGFTTSENGPSSGNHEVSAPRRVFERRGIIEALVSLRDAAVRRGRIGTTG
jgi:hypothetical protein